jgi:hypothetical protein
LRRDLSIFFQSCQWLAGVIIFVWTILANLRENDSHSCISNYRKLCLQLLLEIVKGNRSESLGVDRQLALADAHALYKAGEGRWGTNEDTFIHILATRSAAHLTTVSQYYLQTFGHSLEKVSFTSSPSVSSQASAEYWHTIWLWSNASVHFSIDLAILRVLSKT